MTSPQSRNGIAIEKIQGALSSAEKVGVPDEPNYAIALTLKLSQADWRKVLASLSETEDSKDAARWRALKKLAGYYQDGSQQTVKLYQDDALRSCFIEAGRKTYGTDGSSFNSCIDAAMKDLTDE